MKKVVLTLAVVLLFSGCALVKREIKDKVLPIAREKIPELVIDELDKMVEDGEITIKQREFLQENLFKLLVRLDKKVELMLTDEAEKE